MLRRFAAWAVTSPAAFLLAGLIDLTAIGVDSARRRLSRRRAPGAG